MIAPDGYTLGKCLRSTPRSEVYGAVRDRDGLPVVLKSYAADRSADEKPRAQHEFDVLSRVAGSGIVRALALEAGPERPVLVLQRVPGLSLASYAESERIQPHTFLRIALRMTESIAHIHEHHVLHRDITPGNIFIDPPTLDTYILDFGIATNLGAAQRGRAEAGIEGTLYYISPEQTGRMDRGVDMRSDLYALGASLYHVLVGHPPFQSEDILELIHAHMAKRPLPPCELRKDIPQVLSDIVQKLLQKAPEDRYPSAESLAFDLRRCLEELEESDRISSDWPLGTRGAPLRPVFAQKLFGREREVEALRAHYCWVAQGHCGFVLISGDLGVGKSALVSELRPLLAETNGYLASGKFDPYRSALPYAGFHAAFESLTDQVLTESDARVELWRSRLLDPLGNLAGALVDLVPGLEALLGKVAPVPELGPRETQVRLAIAVQRFLQGFASKDHPLVLVLDDLQWSDSGSRYVIEELLAEGGISGLMLIGTFRAPDQGSESAIEELIERISELPVRYESLDLGPLDREGSTAMLADALGKSPDQARPLADLIALKTGDRPLLIQQFVSHMHELGFIRHTTAGWAWDEAAIAAADIPDDAVSLVTKAIAGLSIDAREVLEIASCVGDAFDALLLSELTEQPTEPLEESLCVLSEHGLIAPCRAGFRFVHDRIREAAQARLGERELAALHYRMGRLLLERTSAAERPKRVFEIADHLNRGLESAPEDARGWMTEIELAAGQRALQAGAPEAALGYLQIGRSLLRESDWTERPEVGFQLYFHSAECAFQAHELELARELLESLARRPLTRMQAAHVAAKQIAVHSITETLESSLRYVLDAIGRFNVHWPERPSRLRVCFDVLRTDWMLRGPLDESTFRPAQGNTDWYAALLVMSAGGPTLALHTARLVCMVAGFALRGYRRRGRINSPTLALAAYAGYRLAVLRSPRGARRYADAAVVWNERLPDPRNGLRGLFHCHAFVYVWLEPRRKVLETLRNLNEACLEVGDLEYAWLSTWIRLQYLALVGESLPALERKFAEADDRVVLSLSQLRPSQVVPVFELLSRRVDAAETFATKLAQADRTLEQFGSQAYFFGTFYVCALYVLGRYEDAFARASRIRQYIFDVSSMSSHVADFCFFSALSAAALAHRGRGRNRRRLLRAAHADFRQLRIYARYSTDFAHMAQLIQAEIARVRRDHANALRLYTQAADGASATGYDYHAAIAHERRADLLAHQRQYTDSTLARRRAARLYSRWGAAHKVYLMKRAFPDLRKDA